MKTLIFDLDETLIHCNESLFYHYFKYIYFYRITLPHDIKMEFTFPSGEKI